MSEFLSTVIKSCRANFGVKWRVFFLNINFCAKISILGNNNWSSVRNVYFLKLLCTTTESEYLIGKTCLLWKFNKYTLTRVFLHAEFIYGMKNSAKYYGFHENVKIIKNDSFFVNCLRFSLKTLEQIVTKSHEILFLDRKEDK